MGTGSTGFPGIVLKDIRIEGGNKAIVNDGGPPMYLENVSATGYSDTGLHARNTNISAKDLYFSSKDARLGWDLERNIMANLYDSKITGHREADLRYGPEVVADIAGLTTRELYNKAKRENPSLPLTGEREVDMAINTTEKKLRQERNRARLNRLLTILRR